jgi:hypothetical protein
MNSSTLLYHKNQVLRRFLKKKLKFWMDSSVKYLSEVDMNNWTLNTLMVKGFPVKIYVNLHKNEAVIFFLFGRYARLSSDKNVLDFATDFLINTHNNGFMGHSAYLSSLEDTSVIEIDTIAA